MSTGTSSSRRPGPDCIPAPAYASVVADLSSLLSGVNGVSVVAGGVFDYKKRKANSELLRLGAEDHTAVAALVDSLATGPADEQVAMMTPGEFTFAFYRNGELSCRSPIFIAATSGGRAQASMRHCCVLTTWSSGLSGGCPSESEVSSGSRSAIWAPSADDECVQRGHVDRQDRLDPLTRRRTSEHSVTRKAVYYIPGGKREPGETDLDTLVREITEELAITIRPSTAALLGTFSAQADGHPDGVTVRMTCYTADYSGTPTPASEIEELAWLTYADRSRVSAVDQVIFDHLHA